MHNYKKEQPVPIVEGNSIRLREITPSDTEFIISHRNNEEIGKYVSFSDKKLTKKEHAEFMSAYYKNNNEYYFIAENLQNNERIGAICLYNIDIESKKAEIGRLFIVPEARMLSFDMTVLTLNFAFEVLNLNKVYGIQRELNPSVEFFLYLGAKKEGLLKEHYWNGKEFENAVYIAVFKKDIERAFSKIRLKLV
jgi:[ribosomal protein S5]-alanine N-acetyltransferase